MKHLSKAIGIFPLLALGTLVLGACQKKPSPKECDELTKHLVGLQISSAGSDKETELKLLESVNSSAHTFCTESLSHSQWQCGMNAKNQADIEKCDFLDNE